MKKLLTVIVSILCATVSVFAQAGMEILAPKVVSPGEIFQVEFVLTNAQCEKFSPPTFTGAEDLVGGAMQSIGSYTSTVNGKRTQASKITFTYTLQAAQSGRVTIGPAYATAPGGKIYNTKSTFIEISSGGRSSVPGSSPQSVTGNSVMLKMETNKTNVYKGEAIIVSLRLYTQVGIAGFDDAKLPAFNGFWQQELKAGSARSERVSVAGKVYESQILKQWLVYPQRSGNLEIEQADVTALVVVENRKGGASQYDLFFGSGSSAQTVRRKVTTSPVRITVKDLPLPTPDDFTGGVGRFNLETSLSTNEIAANSGGSIIIKMTGAGDFPLVDEPYVEIPNGFDKFDTKPSEDIVNTAEGSSGTRTWEIPFIARAEGEYTIPAVRISYFDPAQNKYVSLSGKEMKIKVSKDANPGSSIGGIVSGVTKEDLQILNQDIHYIKNGELRMQKRDTHFMWSAAFFLTVLGIIGAFVASLIMLKTRIKNRANVARTKTKKANAVALRRLKKAKEYMVADNKSGFYEEMLRAMWGYMGDKLTIQVSDLSKERLREEFSKRDVSQDNGDEFLSLISDCEMAQYSPVDNVDMKKAYNQALELIGKLELK